MNFGFIKKAPKIFLVAFLLIGTTVLFWLWWQSRKAAKNHQSGPASVAVENRVVVDFAANSSRYFMADNDLYDALEGKLVAKNFLNGEQPSKILYEPESKKLIGEFANGYVRFNLDGSKDADLLLKTKVAAVPGSRHLAYVKDGDVWLADVDLKTFKTSERKVTSIGQFDAMNFEANMLLLTDKLALLRNQNQLVRVNLDTGQVKPVQTNFRINAKTRSPDSHTVVGIDVNSIQRFFYAYDFESDSVKTIPVPRLTTLADAQWLDQDRCLLLVNRDELSLYDRRKGEPEAVSKVPGFRWLSTPSPSGKHVFCYGDHGAAVVDIDTKSVTPLAADVRGYVWIDDDTLLAGWEGMDSDRRGTWLIKLNGGGEKRVCEEPFLVSNNSPLVLVLQDAGLAVFQTKKGLQKIRLDGTDRQDFTSLVTGIGRLSGIGRLP